MIKSAWLVAGWFTLQPAVAGGELLRNDSFESGDAAYFSGGFIENECWGSVFVPDRDLGPFTLKHVDALVGGSGATQVFIVEVFEVDDTDLSGRTMVGAAAITMTGSDVALNRIEIADLEAGIEDHVFDGTLPMVAVCHDEHAGYPSIARDSWIDHGDRNWLYATSLDFPDLFPWDWYRSGDFLVMGDWIMRACVEGPGLDGECGFSGDSDADADADADADTDADSDADADADADDTGDPVSCATLSEAECAESPDCAGISGWPVDLDGEGDACVDYSASSFAACAEPPGACGDALTFARPPTASSDAECVLFSSTCIPDGWVPCSGPISDSPCPEESCEGDFGGDGPGCCESPDESTVPAMTPATCEGGEWTCPVEGEDICSCAGMTAMYDCVSSCEDGAEATLPFCVYGDHWECPPDTVRSDLCPSSVE